MGRVENKVALITGAARGQGRAHAVRLAEEGADIVAVDICAQIDTASHALASPDDLDETARLVEEKDRSVIARQLDVRDQHALDKVVAEAIDRFGHVDIVVANAAITALPANVWELTEDQWQDTIDINLTGVWHTVKATVPAMIQGGNGGSIVITSSSTAIKARRGVSPYVTAKHGLTGLMRTLALELAPHSIRVNTINPSAVLTDMALNESNYRLFRPDLESPTMEDAEPIFRSINVLPIPWVEPLDIANAVLWLVSDEARYVTGIVLPIDAGSTIL